MKTENTPLIPEPTTRDAVLTGLVSMLAICASSLAASQGETPTVVLNMVLALVSIAATTNLLLGNAK